MSRRMDDPMANIIAPLDGVPQPVFVIGFDISYFDENDGPLISAEDNSYLEEYQVPAQLDQLCVQSLVLKAPSTILIAPPTTMLHTIDV